MTQAGARDGGRSAEPWAPPDQLIGQLLRAAAAAPSMHNTQPWRFRMRDGGRTIELRADPARQLPSGDPAGRAAHIACGAALFNLRLAAAAAGLHADARLLPDPREPLLLATVRLAGPHRPAAAESELHAAIERRHTNRQPFSSRPVPPGVLAELAEAASLEHAILHILDHDEAVRVLNLAADAERAQLAEPAYRAELARWAGGQRDRDGIPDSALGPRSPDTTTPVRDFAPRPRSQPVSHAWFEGTPQLAVLSIRSGGRAGWLRAGQALQRVLLTATARGIATCPLTQPLETTDAWLVRDPRSGSEQPQMILRLGYGLPVPPTPRRPPADILDQPEPAENPPPGKENPG
jgi:nitroreductase